MSSDYRISNINKINKFFQEKGIQKVDEDIVNTQKIIAILQQRENDLEKLIKEWVVYKLCSEIPNLDDKLFLNYLANHVDKVRQRTGLRMPIIVPSDKSVYVLLFVLVVVYGVLFFLFMFILTLVCKYYYSLPI